jgi:beta-N-acetylhexosaminidase
MGAAAAALTTAAGGGPSLHASVRKPHVVWKPIPFGAKRRRETTAYVRRHYGSGSWRLRHPHVIVEHYTGSNSFASTYATFASDARDSELHELPGVCAQFVVDRDGTIYQLVRLNTVCRHTVGLNYTSIGIEHVGTSDAQILHNRPQLKASLRLTLWLMRARFTIKFRNVIGHNESLTNPWHKELYPAWRCQTHGDWTYEDMTIYRKKLRARAKRRGISLGPIPPRRRSKC